VVLGPTADNYITRAFFRPWLLKIWGCDPPMQFIHEDDLARVLSIIIRRRMPGLFNVAGDGVVFYTEVAKITGSRLIPLPGFMARTLVQTTWKLGLQKESPACGLDFLRYPIIMNTSKLKQATGYRFWHTSGEALITYANSRAS
jgi:UDP-glucose 4-epimerase